MDLETVKYEKKDAVALISFNRPEVRNAFNAKMTEDILEALLAAKNDTSIKSIVLTGEGLSFSAGGEKKNDFVREEKKMQIQHEKK